MQTSARQIRLSQSTYIGCISAIRPALTSGFSTAYCRSAAIVPGNIGVAQHAARQSASISAYRLARRSKDRDSIAAPTSSASTHKQTNSAKKWTFIVSAVIGTIHQTARVCSRSRLSRSSSSA